MSEAEDKTAALLAQLWVKNLPIVEERLAVLERAAAAAAGGLDEDLRTEAAQSAHKLAGALGMYGYDEGTRIARELDTLLSGEKPDAARLGELVGELRKAVFPKAAD
jgi:HPt (histidine-containing phosphotransfer) domain-containing protein